MGVGVKAPPGVRWMKPPPPRPGPACNLEAYGHPRDLKGMEPGGEGGVPGSWAILEASGCCGNTPPPLLGGKLTVPGGGGLRLHGDGWSRATGGPPGPALAHGLGGGSAP